MEVVTIATNKRGYGEMAFNMAVSLKSFLPDIKITCISDRRIERVPGFEKVFHRVIKVAEGLNPFELKTRVYSLMDSEFLYLDADSVFIAHPSEIFTEIEDKDFCIMEYARHENSSYGKTMWAKIADLFSHYSLGSTDLFPEYNSSIFYAKKTASNDEYFRSVNDAYKETPVKLLMNVGGFFPDEIAFGVASARLSHYSEIKLWQPLFLQKETLNNPLNLSTITNILTMAGGASPSYSLRHYNSTVAKAGKLLGLKTYPFEQQNKVFKNHG